MNKRLLICGDIHGDLKLLVWTLCIKYNIHDANVIVVGDFGVGFGRPRSMETLYGKVKKRLESFNINLYAIRGNHDDPSWFDGKHNFDRLQFLPDHTTIELSGYEIYPIGGATSTDRGWRLVEQAKMKTKIWWPGEKVKKVKKYPTKVDIILSHTAPIHFGPIPMRSDNMDIDLYEEILEERRYLRDVSMEINWKRWYFGHFHEHYNWGMADKIAKGLGIMELIEIPEKEKEEI